jgi:hypothetical protein
MRFITFGLALLVASVAVAAEPVSLRIRFGMKDKEGQDWSGKLEMSEGSVLSIRGWRWMPGDNAKGKEWTIATRRGTPQSAAERKRVAAGNKLPVRDNGLIATLADAKVDTTITFTAKPGNTSFKVSDVPYGKPHVALDGNLIVERVPTATELATSLEDEDYPAIARGKDGTLFVAYLSFKHGTDFQGVRERPATAESGPVGGPLAAGPVRKIEKPEDLDYLAQPAGGEQIYLRLRRPDGTWQEPVAVTDGKHELYRPAIALDGSGRVWVFYSAHLDADKNLDHGNWELMARSFDAAGKNGGEVIKISNAAGSDFMPAATTDSSGKAWVTWVGGRGANFHVFVAGQTADNKFSEPRRVSASDSNAWEPAIAAGGDGQLAVAWDTYAKGDYDVYLASRNSDGTSFGDAQPVAATLSFEVRPSMLFDKDNRLWIAWEESGDHWGKDFGALKKKGIPLYQTGRSVAVKARTPDGQWMSPPDVMDAMPTMAGTPRRRAAGATPAGATSNFAPSFPRLAADARGSVYLAFRGKPGGNWRTNVGSVWFEYVTRLQGNAWADAVWVPRSSNILDNRPALVGEDGKITMVYSGDGRGEMNPAKVPNPHLEGAPGEAPAADATAAGEPDPTQSDEAVPAAAAQPAQPRRGGGRRAGGPGAEINADLFVTTVAANDFPAPLDDAKAAIALKPAAPVTPAPPAPDVGAEQAAIKTMRDYRVTINGESFRIWRGEFHRHTELSMDGGNDGGLLDMWRYGIDAADLDWIGDGDHDYGAGREYSWWTTQKAVTLFTLDGEFVPMFSYERSVSYPEGHRNCVFARRGVRSLPRLPISDPDVEKPAPDTDLLYVYLKRFDGLCAPHTSATDMGTDWRNHDPEVEPFVEIYQGDRNNYERPDAPRSAVTEAKLKQSTPEKESLGGWRPKGFVNLALKRGYRFAFQSSSDHISTHLSYCNVLVKEPTREAILEGIRKRRVYGATDNIVADVRCKAGDKEHWMGEEFTVNEPPTITGRFIGAQKINKVTIIKDDEEVHVMTPDKADVTFEWTDPKPEPGKTSYYYVRGEQVVDMEGATSGELVWASPMWIKYQPAGDAKAAADGDGK